MQRRRAWVAAVATLAVCARAIAEDPPAPIAPVDPSAQLPTLAPYGQPPPVVEIVPPAPPPPPPPPPPLVVLAAPVRPPPCDTCTTRLRRSDGAMVWLGGIGALGVLGPLAHGFSLGGGFYLAAGFEAAAGWSIRAEVDAIQYTVAGFDMAAFRDGTVHTVTAGMVPVLVAGRYTLLPADRFHPTIDLAAGAGFPSFGIDNGHLADGAVVVAIVEAGGGVEYELDHARSLEIGLRFSYAFDSAAWTAVLDSPDVTAGVASRAAIGTGAVMLYAGLSCCHGSLGPQPPRARSVLADRLTRASPAR